VAAGTYNGFYQLFLGKFMRLAACGAGVHLLRALAKRQSIGFWFQSLVSRQSSQQLQRPSVGLSSG
jgi:hypothetical protein